MEEENRECLVPCSSPTLLLLPHCPKQLTNNLLHSNWSPAALPRLTLVSNSFASTVGRATRRELEGEAPLLLAAVEQGVVREVEVANTFRFTDVFNDLSVHTFPWVGRVGEGFWRVDPPHYREGGEFIRREERGEERRGEGMGWGAFRGI